MFPSLDTSSYLAFVDALLCFFEHKPSPTIDQLINEKPHKNIVYIVLLLAKSTTKNLLNLQSALFFLH